MDGHDRLRALRDHFYVRHKAVALLAAAETLALLAFADRRLAAPLARIGGQGWRLPLLLLAAGLATALLPRLLRSASGRVSLRFGVPGAVAARQLILTLTPLLILPLEFLGDRFLLRPPSMPLLLLATAGILYLQLVWRGRLARRRSPPRPNAPPPESQPVGDRKILLAIFLVGAAAYSFVLLSGILPPLPLTGDEPHYLLVAKSIVNDHDIDLFNNYQRKDYWEFYPGKLETHAYPGRRGPQHMYSKHFPGLPLLVAPAYWIGDRLGKALPFPGMNAPSERNIRVLLARETMALLAAALAACFFSLVWEFSRKLHTALWAWLAFAFTPPLLFYSRLLYAELPVALVIAFVLRQALFKASPSRAGLFWTAAGIAALPWFGVKYIVLAAALLAVYATGQWRRLATAPRSLYWFLPPLILSGALFIFFLWRIYGVFSPSAIYFGTSTVETTAFHLGLKFGQAHFAARALAYFLDQRMGLLVHSPLLALFIPGMLLMARRHKRIAISLLIPTLGYWLFCAALRSHGGYVPPERTLLPLVAILAFFAAHAFASCRSRSGRTAILLLAILALSISVLALVQPRLFYHLDLSDNSPQVDSRAQMLVRVSNAGIDLTRLVPNLASRPDFSWPVLIAWLALLAVISVLVLRRDRNAPPRVPGLGGHVLAVMALALLAAFYSLFAVRIDPDRRMAVSGGAVYFQDENASASEPGCFWTRGDCRADVLLSATRAVRRLELELKSRAPLRAAMRIGSRRFELKSRSRDAFECGITIGVSDHPAWRGRHLILLRLEVDGGFRPHEIDAASRDERFLGLWVRLRIPGDGPARHGDESRRGAPDGRPERVAGGLSGAE